ncbi:NAD-dependent protein deacetylase 1 [Bosea sp. 62]|uniref:SIR2 family NAD-dependent protein deacylase n=1 Tax=unclassified Bosea (in: a-proteobacteria) TaxID=2653178 RepID=UPI00125833AA|nr:MULTISPECIES: Sir2 family NAD-dependent protein deacetylase [unclassified Bosea (in: a-proteobacteria)]CAD5263918.1 NAD-dependent protein deacetylase 1 [Bosea sp. 46]CAD5266158.1 NAD-dependent protein deacetylase 1 [Bosea sp. 21B]CAD5273469.1 NAD-dependent protein deacetylase 1 [Bosea sp. 7B]VVT56589.1 NAD-dependent protein deacetylase 1 [Bosea sp. EC-HK365B]VXB79226.1 NAD-dependent protein deacetylase 1 [Bosea sp. 29B]
MDDETQDAIEELHAMLDRARVIVPFTGAGISTESGVPDFRSPGSPWMRNKPIPFEAFLASREARIEAWRRKFAMDDHYRDARPNRGHRALATLVAEGRSPGVITQNIDGLHQASGIAEDGVIELHGNGTYATCLTCGWRHELATIRAAFEASGEPAACMMCAGIVKTATISFGQQMPQQPMLRAHELTMSADLYLVAGSSLVVFPAATFPVIAKRNGAKLVILNREPTDLDPIADLVVRSEIGPVLARLAN